jgi:hypothetical protein
VVPRARAHYADHAFALSDVLGKNTLADATYLRAMVDNLPLKPRA